MIPIRQMRATEGAALRAIRLQALRDTPTAFGSTIAETESRPLSYWDERAVEHAAGQKSVMFVAEDAGTWVGLVGSLLEGLDNTLDVELFSMWVSPKYRRQGLGERLVEQIIAWAGNHDAKQIVLWVTKSNAPAVSLYTRCGFKTTGEVQPLPSKVALIEQRMVLEL